MQDEQLGDLLYSELLGPALFQFLLFTSQPNLQLLDWQNAACCANAGLGHVPLPSALITAWAAAIMQGGTGRNSGMASVDIWLCPAIACLILPMQP